jgi:hypothetical protein
MAGFAIFMTILTYGVVALTAASVTSLCLFFFMKRRVSQETANRRRVIVMTTLAPFLALLWLVVALLIHVQISNRLAHQDCGFSPDPYVTLPNGYVLGSNNTYDGYIKAPGFETDVPVAGPGYVRSIIDLQLSNGDFIGTQFDLKTSKVRQFTFDTRTRTFQTSDPNYSGATESQPPYNSDVDAWAAAETSAHDDANSYWVLYAQYRHQWPNYILITLVVAGESAIVFGVRKLWASGMTKPASSQLIPSPKTNLH